MNKFIDAYIITWPGKHDGARQIARELEDVVDRLTVLYANKEDRPEEDEPSWQQFPNSWYFGAQFQDMIGRFEGDVLLHVMADADCADWPGLVAALREVHARMPETGLWSPNVDHSAQPLAEVSLGPIANSSMHQALQTDCTVWALSRDVVKRMKRFDYSLTPLGWGIDIAAALYCHSQGKPVLISADIPVVHPRTTGYDGSTAEIQKARFLTQLSSKERRLRKMLARRLPAAARRLIFSAVAPHRYKQLIRRFEG